MSSVERLRKYVKEVAGRVKQVYEVIFTDRDGVPIFKCTVDSSVEMASLPPFLTTQAVAVDQLAKIGVGNLKYVAFFYNQYQVVLIQYGVTHLTLIASAHANTSRLLDLGKDLFPLIQKFQSVAAHAANH
ncbi:ragulator complex protein LAMTOR3 [Trichuris trichiura]|uniref:Ragulator complex protein LAMTOR3 n=1 Tax=Trichuris trichiura TaxID=36087 RepID=A0A077ZCM6_TRITR|nr:ragulator complex protein LAMTOR3 [Trichuris trichiura]